MEAQEAETAASPISQQRHLLQAMRQYLAQQEEQEKEGEVNHGDGDEEEWRGKSESQPSSTVNHQSSSVEGILHSLT